MENHASGTGSPTEVGHQSELSDEQVLAQAMWESVYTSPEAFLKKLEDIKSREPDYWRKEIDSSTWAVIQRGNQVIGVAVAKWPDQDMDSNIDPTKARFIESVWIAPEFRRRHLGERLVRFLMEQECAKSPTVRQFLLWVLDNNKTAISMYVKMGFMFAGMKPLDGWRGGNQYEHKYEYQPERGTAEQDCDEPVEGLIYRVLGQTA